MRHLTGAQEFLPVPTAATGTLTLDVNAARTQIDYQLETVGPQSQRTSWWLIFTLDRLVPSGHRRPFFCVNRRHHRQGYPVPQPCPTTGGTIAGTLTAADLRPTPA